MQRPPRPRIALPKLRTLSIFKQPNTPTIAQPFVVINSARIQGAETMELDWPVTQITEEEEEANARGAVIAIAAICFLVTALIQLGGVLWVRPEAIIAGTTLSFAIAFAMVVRRVAARGVAVMVWLSGAVLPILFFLIYKATQMPGALVVTTALAAAAAFYFIEEFKLHFVTRMLADLFVPRRIRQERREWYRNRHLPPELARILREMEQANVPEQVLSVRREEFRAMTSARLDAILVILFGTLVTLLSHKLLSATLSLVATPYLTWFFFGRVGTPTAVLKILWLAWRSWVNYERMPAPAPGVWHSPAGIWPWRMALAAAAVFFLATSLLPSTQFYPLGWELTFGHWFPEEVKAAMQIAGSPAWMLPVAEYVADRSWFLWVLGASLIASIVGPVVVLVCALYASAGAFLVPAYVALGAERALERMRRES